MVGYGLNPVFEFLLRDEGLQVVLRYTLSFIAISLLVLSLHP